MKRYPKTDKLAQQSDRRGFTVTEMLVSALLLTTVMSVVGPLAVRGDRLWQDARHGRLALEELSSQLDRLTCLTEDQRKAALAELAPSEYTRGALPNPKLSAETVRDQDGQRLVLQLTWKRPAAPGRMTLVGWIDPRPEPSTKETP
jgi:hypothetical protein